MTKEEFISSYCERSGMTREYFDKWFAAKPCNCDFERCRGWIAGDNSPGLAKIPIPKNNRIRHS